MIPLVRIVPLLLLVAPALGCSDAKNTPEQALAQVKKALKEQRWELLYELVPPELQKEWKGEIDGINEKVEGAVARYGADKADDLVHDQLGLSLADWQHADDPHRFALIFAPGATMQLRELGVNPEEVLSSEVKGGADVKGDQAFFLIDDGKGHRTKLRFKLVDGLWRFDLEKIKKDGGG